MTGMFLDNGIDHIQDQLERERMEIRKKKAEGYVRVRAINPITNKLETRWVKKDEATLEFDKEDKRKEDIKKKARDIERRKQMLELRQSEKEIEDNLAELEAMEKEMDLAEKKAREDELKAIAKEEKAQNKENK